MKLDFIVENVKKYPVTSAAYVLAVVMALALFFTGNLLDDLKKEHDQAIALEDVVIYNLRNAKDLDKQIKALKDFNESLKHHMIDPSERASNFQYFFGLEAKAKVKIENPRQLRVVPLDAPQGAAAPGVKSNHGTVGISQYRIDAVGSYDNILKLIFALQSGNYLCRVTDVTLEHVGTIEPNGLTANVGVSFFGKPD